MLLKSALAIFSTLIVSYTAVKSNISTSRKQLSQSYKISTNKTESLNQIKNKFTNHLVNEIISQWYETKWSFDGYSETPKKGTIACGYFVSTTLRDVGFNINRFKMAQKSPLEEAKIVACGNEIITLKNKSKVELKNYFNTKKDGVYFIGLDFHVGYIYKQGTNIYFIHSNYIENKGVMKEKIEDSKAIISDIYYISDITHNQKLMIKWLDNEIVSTN